MFVDIIECIILYRYKYLKTYKSTNNTKQMAEYHVIVQSKGNNGSTIDL